MQKADVAQLIRSFTKKRLCCIGDGGNDVSMIQAANVSACVARASHPCYAHRHNLFPLPISSGVKIVSKEGK